MARDVSIEAIPEGRDAIGLDFETSGRRMTAMAFEQFIAGSQCCVKREAGHASPAAGRDRFAGLDRYHERRLTEVLDQSVRNNPDHARMPARGTDDDRRILGEFLLDELLRLLRDSPFKRLALGVLRLEELRQFRGLIRRGRCQEFDGETPHSPADRPH